jgi:hypothetical protein
VECVIAERGNFVIGRMSLEGGLLLFLSRIEARCYANHDRIDANLELGGRPDRVANDQEAAEVAVSTGCGPPDAT